MYSLSLKQNKNHLQFEHLIRDLRDSAILGLYFIGYYPILPISKTFTPLLPNPYFEAHMSVQKRNMRPKLRCQYRCFRKAITYSVLLFGNSTIAQFSCFTIIYPYHNLFYQHTSNSKLNKHFPLIRICAQLWLC